MVLLHHVVQIFDLTDRDGSAMLLIIGPDGRSIGLTPIDGNRLRDPMAADGLFQKAQGGVLIPLRRQQKVNRLAVFIDRTIEVIPLAFDPDVDPM
jgi:hypothetical protein